MKEDKRRKRKEVNSLKHALVLKHGGGLSGIGWDKCSNDYLIIGFVVGGTLHRETTKSNLICVGSGNYFMETQ